MDQCKHCDARGDMARCAAVECGQHDMWYASELRAEVARLDRELGRIEDMNLELSGLICLRLPECGPLIPLEEVNEWIDSWNERARAALAGEEVPK